MRYLVTIDMHVYLRDLRFDILLRFFRSSSLLTGIVICMVAKDVSLYVFDVVRVMRLRNPARIWATNCNAVRQPSVMQ